mmetsp:Transcript_54183/g.129051  ORF Transcript_54183/g.129051 Transcript_54183/m.129051 type:complete len:403 (+) Transcript_54183:115-1323(+)|eukprot:CAMPEP_0178443250 /NCGR_PEP_ID=MMETSP0689_2-20121128/38756_1 /TAXON_ID=160604 /ORGANISM="Amphidinium massartii, Strain CS-259" /LENGTH=402 /DNA_ID=CAMNT_0020067167 /DNA_START=105 /DNA_END=1313 /DNA_ORIENTATION=+
MSSFNTAVNLGSLIPWSEVQAALGTTFKDYPKSKAVVLVGGTAAMLWASPVGAAVARTCELVVSLRPSKHSGKIQTYNGMYDDESSEARKEAYSTLVDSYYDLATAFYEWGWGYCFHFAFRRKTESWRDAYNRHETLLASKLNVAKGATLLDCGCGVGGPARVIAQFLGCQVKGVTINGYQVKRGNTLSGRMGLNQQVQLIQADFMKLPFQDAEFDGVYAIESTCHAPNREGVYSEIMRVLKPGGVFATYEWGLTSAYDPSSEEHRLLKHRIEVGDGLPDLIQTTEITGALIAAGFEVLEARDYAEDSNVAAGDEPWYGPLLPSWNPLSWPCFQFNALMQAVLPWLLRFGEIVRILPADVSKTREMLLEAGLGCRAGGLTNTFTPMWLMVAKKPLTPATTKK